MKNKSSSFRFSQPHNHRSEPFWVILCVSALERDFFEVEAAAQIHSRNDISMKNWKMMKNEKKSKKKPKTLKKKGFLLESGVVAPVDLIALVYVGKRLRSAFFLSDNHLAILARSEKIRGPSGGHWGLRKQVHV